MENNKNNENTMKELVDKLNSVENMYDNCESISFIPLEERIKNPTLGLEITKDENINSMDDDKVYRYLIGSVGIFREEDLVVIDPAFFIENQDDWDRCNGGADMGVLGIAGCITYSTDYEVFNVITEVKTEDGYNYSSKLINVPTGRLCVIKLSELLNYNPEFDVEQTEEDCNCCLIKDYTGDIRAYDIGFDGELIQLIGPGVGETDDFKEVCFKVEQVALF